ncbi:MAG: hypothetical protein ABI383_08435 [Acidobacteriaceae bacterium]
MDSWIAISQDGSRLVAVGKSFGEVSHRLDELGDEDSVILKTPEEWIPMIL